MVFQKCKKQLDASGQWLIERPIWNWILLHLIILLLLFLVLLVTPCLLNLLSRFLQQKIQKFSN